jgi:signal transduction histidine kinase
MDVLGAALRLRSWLPRARDLAMVVPVVAVVIVGTIHLPVEHGERPIDAIAYLCGIGGAVALAFWRRAPLFVLGIVAVTTAVYSARNYTGGPALLPGPLALLLVGYATPRRTGWIAAAGFVGVTMVARLWFGKLTIVEMLVLVGWSAAAVLAGQALAARGERAAAQREQAAHEAERALANERLRIAQDLHDSVAHAMSTINVQSGVAAHLLDRDPAQAKSALEAIRAASSDALDELTTILSAMREPGGTAPRMPLPTLADIHDLVTRARADGLYVSTTVHGDITHVPATTSAAAFRVVQEALTNTRRHAGAGARTEVDVKVSEHGSLSVRVCDDGGSRPNPGAKVADGAGGFGLVGMRERIESTGGSLVAGHADGGGFEVVAEWVGRR